jgi:two-component system cell cycle response regulator PopA
VRLVIRSPDARRARALQGVLEPAELSAAALIGPAAYRASPHGEDIALLDAQSPDAEDFVRALRKEVNAALAYVGVSPASPRKDAPFDAWLSPALAPALMRRRLETVFRDGVCFEEVRARRRTAAAQGMDAPLPAPARGKATALFVGAPKPAFLALERAWRGHGGAIAGAFTSFSAFDQLHDDKFDAVILNAIDDAAAALSLCGAMRRNAKLHHVPTLMLIAGPEGAQAALDRGASWLAYPDEDLAAAAAWLAEDVRRARKRREALHALECIPAALGAWTEPQFAAHLETLAGFHHQRGRPLSLASARLVSPAARTDKWRRGFNDLAQLARRLVRASDSYMEHTAEALVFAFPAAEEAGARAALQRLVSVWDCTAFAAGEAGAAPLRFDRRTYELAPGERGAALYARLMRGLEERVKLA